MSHDAYTFLSKPDVTELLHYLNKAQITELLMAERHARDAGDWHGMLAAYAPEASVDIGWFSGSAAEFVAATRRAYENRVLSLHQIGHPVITIRGKKALSDTPCVILVGSRINGVAVNVLAYARAQHRFVKSGTSWRIAGLRSIYQTDMLIPVSPADNLRLDYSKLAGFRSSYRHLAYLNMLNNMPPRHDKAGTDRPETVSALLREEHAWLLLADNGPFEARGNVPDKMAHGAASMPAASPLRAGRPDKPSRPVRPDDSQLFDSRVAAFRDREIQQVKVAGRFTVAVGGDIISTFPISQLEDPRVQAVLSVIRGADVGVANSESNIVDYTKAHSCLGGMMGPKETAPDIKAMGFDILNKASNHTTDVGAASLTENLQILRDAGLVVAGSGRNLQEARAASYLSTSKGRVGVVGSYAAVVDCHQGAPESENSGSDQWITQLASYQLGLTGGVPGVNPLRLTRYHVVSQSDFEALCGIDAANRAGRGDPMTPSSSPLLNFGGHWYKAGPEQERGTWSYQIYPDDLKQIERSVRNGKEQCDFLAVMVHAHQISGRGAREPDFLIAYAHAMIESGADLFARSGPWALRGIEIFKGRPIFYGLGLTVGTYMCAPVGYERYRDNEIDPFETTLTDAELSWTYGYGANILTLTNPDEIVSMESAVAEVTYDAGKLVTIVLTPIQLAYDRPMSQVGIPRVATGSVAQRILERVARLSDPFGTELVIKGDKGYILNDRCAT